MNNLWWLFIILVPIGIGIWWTRHNIKKDVSAETEGHNLKG